MLAAIDVGNTNTVVGFYEADRLVAQFRLASHRTSTSDEVACLLEGLMRMEGIAVGAVDSAVLASVVPPLTAVFAGWAERWLKVVPLIVGPETDTGITVLYTSPRDVGADRIVNAVAGHVRHPGADLVIVDFGTATTFDAVTAAGEYLGGVIVPGVTVSLDALFLRTAKLPRVDVVRPDGVIGRDTVHSIQSGAYFGYLSMVEGLVTRMKSELHAPVRVLATGGLAPLLCGESTSIDQVIPDLTLEGLRLIWERNAAPATPAGPARLP
jgi:type III pantothenate kinase